MVIINIMVTISIHPYSARKVGLVGLTLFCLSCLSVFAQSTYINVSSTPYDRQMTRIRPVLAATEHKDKNLSFGMVNHWIQDLRAIPYGFSTEWKTPDEVQTSPFADCKGKAVTLYNAMHSRGAQNTAGATYILDPTINWSACRAERFGRSSYIPLYAYAGGQKFRAATSSTLLAKNQFLGGQRVASRL